MRFGRFLLGLFLLSGAAWGFGHGFKTLAYGHHCPHGSGAWQGDHAGWHESAPGPEAPAPR